MIAWLRRWLETRAATRAEAERLEDLALDEWFATIRGTRNNQPSERTA